VLADQRAETLALAADDQRQRPIEVSLVVRGLGAGVQA